MKKHFVEFFSPGTFVAETSTRPIDSWDLDEAIKLSADITERYGATPYAFRFITRERADDELDSKVTKHSFMHYLGGKIETIEDVAKRADPKEAILLSNMRCNGWNRIITSTKGWKWTQPLNDDDIVLEVTK